MDPNMRGFESIFHLYSQKSNCEHLLAGSGHLAPPLPRPRGKCRKSDEIVKQRNCCEAPLQIQTNVPNRPKTGKSIQNLKVLIIV